MNIEKTVLHLYETSEVIYVAASVEEAQKLFAENMGFDEEDLASELLGDAFEEVPDDRVMEIGFEDPPDDEPTAEKRKGYWFVTKTARQWADGETEARHFWGSVVLMTTHCLRCQRERGYDLTGGGAYCTTGLPTGNPLAAHAECSEHYIQILEKRIGQVINTDRSGLAAALNEVQKVASGHGWLAEGHWGSYPDDQQTEETLRKEVGFLIQKILNVCHRALKESGDRATEAARESEQLALRLPAAGTCLDCEREVDHVLGEHCQITAGSRWIRRASAGDNPLRRVISVVPIVTQFVTGKRLGSIAGDWGDRVGEFLSNHTYVSSGKETP